MLMRRGYVPGLGYNPQIGSDGAVVDCDSFSNMFQTVCWNPLATGVPLQVSTDPVTGEKKVTPNLDAVADKSQGAGGGYAPFNVDWTTVAVAAMAIVAGLVALTTVLGRR